MTLMCNKYVEYEFLLMNNVFYEMFGISGFDLFMAGCPRRSHRPLRVAFFTYFLFINMPIYFMSQIYHIFFTMPDLTMYILNLGIFLNAVCGFVKGVTFFVNISEMERLCLKFERFIVNRVNSDLALKLLKEKARFLRRLSNIFLILPYSVFIVWCIWPVLESEAVLNFFGITLEKTRLNKILPSVYPVDMTVEPNYTLIYIFEVLSGVSGLTYLMPVDMFFISVCEMYITQVEILKQTVAEKIHLKSWEMNCKDFNITCVVKEHSILLKLLKDIGTRLSIILSIQWLTSVTSICSIILSFSSKSGQEDYSYFEFMSARLKLCMYFGVIMAELLLYCIIISRIKQANSSIGEAMYCQDWANIPDNNYRLHTQMIITRSQHPVDISALGIVKIDLASIIDVIRISYSYYTFLRELN